MLSFLNNFLLVFSLFFCCVLNEECGYIKNHEERIVGGEESKIFHPWYGLMYKKGKMTCGSSLINTQYVISAAHCVYGVNSEDVVILFGANDRCRWNESQILLKVNKIIVHEKFSKVTTQNDISLIKLERTINLMPICLPDQNFQISNYKSGLIVGFGAFHYMDKFYPCKIQQATIEILTNAQCMNTELPVRIAQNPNIICAGKSDGSKDTCQGDSGSPLIGQTNGVYIILGLVSFGFACGSPNVPGVYTNIKAYLNWISKNLN